MNAMYPDLPPASEITEIVGRLSSGRTSLFVAWLSAITRAGGAAALVDVDDAFEPVAAARAGVDLARVLWVRCAGRRRVALSATDVLVRRPGFALVALDGGEMPPRLTLDAAFRLKLTVRRTHAALVLLGGRRTAGSGAALVIETAQDALEWTGPGPRTTRLAALRTRLAVVRPRATGAWPRDARFTA
jgi:RecA DNA recombination protein